MSSPTVSTELGILIDSIPVLAKACAPIVFTESGMVSVRNRDVTFIA
jgi:hypothetical protein